MDIRSNGEIKEISVPLLTDLDINSEPIQDIIRYASYLIKAAKEDRLAAVVCQHGDSSKLSTVLCYTYDVEGSKQLGYIPVGMLFDSTSEAWNNLSPPTGAKAN